MFLLLGRKITLDSSRDLGGKPSSSQVSTLCLLKALVVFDLFNIGVHEVRAGLGVLQCQARKGVTQINRADGVSVWGGLEDAVRVSPSPIMSIWLMITHKGQHASAPERKAC